MRKLRKFAADSNTPSKNLFRSHLNNSGTSCIFHVVVYANPADTREKNMEAKCTYTQCPG